jgi:Mn2+/Fe2+ NRAMP family transporter
VSRPVIRTNQLLVIVGAVVIIVLSVIGLVVGLVLATDPNDQRSSNLIITTLAVIGPTLVGLLAYIKSSNVQADLHSDETLKPVVSAALDEHRDKLEKSFTDALTVHRINQAAGINAALAEHRRALEKDKQDG